MMCRKHPNWPADECVWCTKASKESVHINTGDWVKGVYEHIGPEPIYIESKKQLMEECAKHGNMARCLMKPKSQGRGDEMRLRGR